MAIVAAGVAAYVVFALLVGGSVTMGPSMPMEGRYGLTAATGSLWASLRVQRARF